MKLKILSILLLVIGLGFQQASAQNVQSGHNLEEHNLLPNHNFADGFNHWLLYGATAEQDFNLVDSPNDNGQMVEYFTSEHLDPGGIDGDNIELVSRFIAAEGGVEYKVSAYFQAWDGPEGTIPSNMKIRFFSIGEEDNMSFLGEDFINFPGQTEDWQNLEITMVAPEGADSLDIVFDTFGSAGDVETEINLDAVYVVDTANLGDEPTSVDEGEFADRPEQIRLEQNFPNPFNPTTQIQFSLNQSSYVTLDVYNVQGQHVKRLVGENRGEGVHQVQFDGSSLSSGLYLYRLQAGEYTEVRKMTLIK